MATRIFNIIGWLGTAFVFAAVAIRFGMLERVSLPGQDRYAYYLAWAGLACMIVYTSSQWREIARVFSRRQARQSALAVTGVFVVLAILTAINYIAKQQSKRWDLTAARQYTLSDQSRNILAKLDAPLEVLVFDRETEFQRFRDRLREYESGSKQMTIEYVDPDRRPTVAQQHAVQQYGTIVLNFKGRTERVTSDTEQDITNGIIKVVTGQQRKLYFTQGHAEKDMASSDRVGYSSLAEALKRENYLVETVAIAQRGEVPADAVVVIIAGPAIDFFPQEIDALKKYLGGGGKLLIELDPPQKADSPPLTNLVALAREWGIEVGNDAILDVSGMGRLFGASEEVPVAVAYPPHAITERFKNVMTAYPLARSVTPVPGGTGGHTAQTIVETGRNSWAESDLKAVLQGRPVQLDAAGGDKMGPVALAAAVSAPVPPADPTKVAEAGTPAPETRVVVFGDSDFASNAAAGIAGNVDLLMNTVGWLSQQENLISVRPKEAADRRITLTAAQQLRINWLALAVIPGFIFGTGIMRWWRRR